MTIRITDHAVLRWLERIHGVDIEGMRAHLLADIGPMAAMASTIGPRFVVKREDGKYLFEGETLVTVVRPDQVIYRRWINAAKPTNEVAP